MERTIERESYAVTVYCAGEGLGKRIQITDNCIISGPVIDLSPHAAVQLIADIQELLNLTGEVES